PELATAYGTLRYAAQSGRPHVIANFVTTLDGVVALDDKGNAGGGAISGNNANDRAVMGLLRATADAVVVGAGTLRSVPMRRWPADYIYPPLRDAYHALRDALGKKEPPLNVIVTARGDLDLRLPVFSSGEVPALIVTTAAAADRLSAQGLPSGVRVAAASDAERVSATAVLTAVLQNAHPCDVLLLEGGPRLMADFFAERRLDELFLTLAPQVAGRDSQTNRLALVEGAAFAPGHPIWGALTSVKRAEDHLFLRYTFPFA